MDAIRLLREAGRAIPGDPVLVELEEANTVPSLIETDPPGAEVYVNSYLNHDQPWMHLGTSPLEVRLPVEVIRFKIEKTFPHYSINKLSLPFLNPELRPATLATRYMLNVPRQ